jgi:hypothetical protein
VAVVGEAKVIIRAVTDRLKPEIMDAFNSVSRDAEAAGRRAGEKYSEGVQRGVSRGIGGGARDTILNQFFSREYLARAEQARQQLRTFNLATILVTTSLIGLIGAIGSLIGPLTAAAAALSQASRTLIVLPAIIGTVVQAAIVLATAFRGVGQAISAGLQAQRASGRSLAAEEQALRRLRDARLALKRLIEEEKPEALAEARQRAADAADNAAEALRGAERAERNYFEAQEEVLDATNALNDAREEAKERLQQLRFETEGAAISEKRARIEFEKARESLQRVQDLPPNSRARQEAELAFASADLNLRRAIDRNSDLKKEENKATLAGVEGSDQVLDAKERLADAYQNEQDAAFEAAKAFRDAARAQEEAARAAADAAAGGRVERDLDERIARAREAVRDAEQALKEGAGGVDAYREALAKLSPEARKFVEYFVDEFIPAVRVLSAAAGRRFFEPLTEGFQLLQSRVGELEPLFENTGGILGRLSKGFFELFFSAENFGRTQEIWRINDTLLGRLGDTVLNLVDGLLDLLVAAEPVIDAFGRWALSTSTGWLKGLRDDTRDVTGEFEEALKTASRIFGVFGTLGEGLGYVFNAAEGEGNAIDIFLTNLESKVTSFRDSAKAANDDGSLSTYLNNATANGILLLDTIGEILGAFGDIADDEGTGQFLQSLKDTATTFREALPEFTKKDGALAGLGKLIENLGDIFLNLNESGAFETFFDTLNSILEKVNEFLEDPNNKKIINFLATIAAFGLAIGVVYRPIKFIGEAIVGLGNMLLGNVFVQGLMGKGKLGVLGRVLFGAGVAAGAGGVAGGGLAAGGGILGKTIDGIKDTFKPNSPGAQGRSLAKAGTAFAGKAALRTGITAASGPAAPIVGAILAVWTLIDVISLVVEYWDEITAAGDKWWSDTKTWWTETVVPWLGEVGAAIAAPFVDAWEAASIAVKDWWQGIEDWWNNTALPFLQGLPGTAVDAFWDWLSTTKVGESWAALEAWWNTTALPFLEGLPGTAVDAFWDWLSETEIGQAWSAVEDWWETVAEPWLDNLPDRVRELTEDLWDGIGNNFPGLQRILVTSFNGIASLVNPAIRAINNWRAQQGIAALTTLPILQLTQLAKGGVVMPTAGGTLAVIGEAGQSERVEPLDANGLSKRDKALISFMGGTGTTINVYPSEGMNEQELAKKVSRELAYQLRRGAV